MPVNPTVFTPEPITTTPQVYVDGEDLNITTENSNEVVKLRDRVATATESIKQGYKRVRQDAVLNTAYFQANTTYEFIYHHDLNNATITFPEGVILNFNGGKLDKGTLIGNHTAIVAPITLIFKRELKIDKDGTWNIDRAYSDWFECYKNGYYIDPTTFVEDYTDPEAPVRTYEYNSVVYNAGTLCGATYNNDRHILQQLLNLSANHTIISEGIYMVDSAGGTGENLDNQLTWFKKKGLTLQIDGILKMIPNSYTNYDVLLIAECDNVKLCGSGKLVGDLPEHQGTTGEGGMCLQVNSTIGLYLEDLTFEQGWGDGVYYSWPRYSPYTHFDQAKHYWNGVKCLYNRRTGFVVEKGDYLDINHSEFNYTGTFSYTTVINGTFSGVDIEPFGEIDAPQRYCKEIHFNTCIAKHNGRGPGFRFERLLGGSVTHCDISDNQTGIALLVCTWMTDNLTGVTPNYVKNRIVIDSNTLKNNYGDTFWGGRPIDSYPNILPQHIIQSNSAIITNNFIQNTACIISGSWVDTIVENNLVYNTGNVFSLSQVITNFKFLNNYVYGIDAINTGTVSGDSGAMFEIRFWGDPSEICGDVLIKDNIFKYAGGKIIHGSGINDEPLPYPSVKSYLFYHTFAPTNSVKYINNHFDDELWGPFYDSANGGAYYDYPAVGDLGLIRERVLRESDLDTLKHLLTGDKLDMYGQIGLVTRGGWLDVVGTEFVEGGANVIVKKGQFFHNTARTAMFIPTLDGNAGNVFPVGWDVNGIPIQIISFVQPIIEWQGIGTCTSTTRPTTFNTLGRRLIETDTGDMIMWNGTAWVVV